MKAPSSMRSLYGEAASVSQAKGVALTDEHINEVIHKFRYVHADNATSSLQRGFRIRRKQTELETFSGYIVKEAKRLGVSIPLSEKNISGTYGNSRKNSDRKGEFSGGILYALVQWGI